MENNNQTPPSNDIQKTIESLQQKISELEKRNALPSKDEQAKSFSEDKSNNFYDNAKKQLESENAMKERDSEIADLKEFELTFDKYIEDNKIFITPTALKTIEFIKNSNLSDGEKMKVTKSTLISDTFSIAENFNSLIDEDKKEIQKFLSFKDDVKSKQANHYFTILKRFLSQRKQNYTAEMKSQANKGFVEMTDPKFNIMADLSKKSANKFLNINDWQFKVVKK